MVVHDIEMDNIGTSGQYVIDFLAKSGKIGRQDGRGNLERVHDGSLERFDNGIDGGTYCGSLCKKLLGRKSC
jgi:hypothetical protein